MKNKEILFKPIILKKVKLKFTLSNGSIAIIDKVILKRGMTSDGRPNEGKLFSSAAYGFIIRFKGKKKNCKPKQPVYSQWGFNGELSSSGYGSIADESIPSDWWEGLSEDFLSKSCDPIDCMSGYVRPIHPDTPIRKLSDIEESELFARINKTK